MRPLPASLVASLNGRAVVVSTLELASRDCVSALTLVCGGTSAIVPGLLLSLSEAYKNVFASRTQFPAQSTSSTRKDRGVVLVTYVVDQHVRLIDVHSWDADVVQKHAALAAFMICLCTNFYAHNINPPGISRSF